MLNMTKTLKYLILISLIGCGSINNRILELDNSEKQNVVYQTEIADFYFSRNALIEYCEKAKNYNKNSNIKNDFNQIIKYLKNESQNDKIIINDTLATKLVIDENGKAKRVNDFKSEYYSVKDRIRFLIPDFAKKGKLNIYYKAEKKYLDMVIYRNWNSKYSGGKELRTLNDSLVFHQIEWIK